MRKNMCECAEICRALPHSPVDKPNQMAVLQLFSGNFILENVSPNFWNSFFDFFCDFLFISCLLQWFFSATNLFIKIAEAEKGKVRVNMSPRAHFWAREENFRGYKCVFLTEKN